MANPWDNDPVIGGKTSSPEEFAKVYGPAAERAGKALGVDPGILLGQWGLETGWGKSIIPGTNNLGNIKDFSGSGVAATDNMTGSRDKYRSYATPEEFADDFTSLIQRKYSKAAGAKDALAFATALKEGGYAEDPRYVDKVVQASRMAGTKTNPVVAAVGKAVESVVPAAQAAGNPWDNDPIVEAPQAPAKAESPGIVDTIRGGVRAAQQATKNLGLGAVRGAGSIGATLVAPYDIASDALAGKGLSLESNRQRRADMDSALQSFGADTNSLAFQGGKLAGEVAGTAGAGNVLAIPARAVGATRFGNALATSGMAVGRGGAPVSNMLMRVSGGGLSGAAQAGLVNPEDALMGGAIGGAFPVVTRVAGGIGGAIRGAGSGIKDMATTAGQSRIAEDILRASATNPEAASASLAKAKPVLEGSKPTMAQVANDPGLAQLERTLLNNPEIAPGLQQRFAEQRAARGAAIDRVAGSGGHYEDIVAGRRVFANEDYAKALNTPIDPAVAQEMAPQIASLMERPSIKSAIADAKRLASETGETLTDTGSVRGLDWIKKALDNKISMASSPASGIGKADLAALQQTKRDLMSTIEQLSPAYKEANDNFAKMSRKVNSMEVARSLDKSYTPVAANFGTSAKEQGNAYMKALTQAQGSVKKSTGMDRPLSEVMDTADIFQLENVGRDLARKEYAESAGRATGSPTAQNMMSQALIRRIMEGAGLPAEAAASNTVLNTLMRPVQFAGKLAEPRINNRLAELALNPEMAAQALREMPPKQAAQVLAQMPPNQLAALASRMGVSLIPYRVAPVLAAD